MILDKLAYLNDKVIVLASGSPQRKKILQDYGLKFQIVPSSFAEDIPKSKYSTANYPVATSWNKAVEVTARLAKSDGQDAEAAAKPDLIIACDTIVALNDEVIEKPNDEAHAMEMLKKLSGATHSVYTGVTLMLPKQPIQQDEVQFGPVSPECYFTTFVVQTDVQFAQLSDHELRAYIQSGEPFGNAGGYGIQGLGGALISGINGCYYNVVGLPLHAITNAISKLIQQGIL